MRSLALISTVLFAGCFNPDDILPIKGSVERAGQKVSLSRAQNPEGGDCSDWKRLKTIEASEDGSFVLDVFRAQATNLATFELYCFLVETTYDSGARVSSTIEQLFGEVQLLAFPEWKPNLRREDGEFKFTPVRERTTDGSLIVQHTLEVKRGDQVVWRTTDLLLGGFTETAPLARKLNDDPRIYDEFGGDASLTGFFVEVPMRVEGPIESQVIRPAVDAISPERMSLTETRVPLSRGSACGGFPQPCGLTDGQLDGVELAGEAVVSVALPQPGVPSLIVLRALVTNSPVVTAFGTQADGGVVQFGTFALLREGDPPGATLPDGRYESAPTFIALPIDAGVEVESVWIGAESLERVDEISVW